jgi:hypothetical protein
MNQRQRPKSNSIPFGLAVFRLPDDSRQMQTASNFAPGSSLVLNRRHFADLPAGVSQQQGSGGSLTFTSQYDIISVSTLPVVSVDGMPREAPAPAPVPQADPSHAATTQQTTFSPRSNALPTCRRKAFSRQRSSPPRSPASA